VAIVPDKSASRKLALGMPSIAQLPLMLMRSLQAELKGQHFKPVLSVRNCEEPIMNGRMPKKRN
jgi:hypothetical protein